MRDTQQPVVSSEEEFAQAITHQDPSITLKTHLERWQAVTAANIARLEAKATLGNHEELAVQINKSISESHKS